MSEEDRNEKGPFEEGEDQELLSEQMIKMISFLMHKYADQRHEDYKEVQKKCKKKFAYSNLAKMPAMEGHAMITKLIKLTGGEEEDQTKTAKQETTKNEKGEVEEFEAEIGNLAAALQICVGNSREIVREELAKENITEGTKAILIKSFAATLFIEAMKRGLAR